MPRNPTKQHFAARALPSFGRCPSITRPFW